MMNMTHEHLTIIAFSTLCLWFYHVNPKKPCQFSMFCLKEALQKNANVIRFDILLSNVS